MLLTGYRLTPNPKFNVICASFEYKSTLSLLFLKKFMIIIMSKRMILFITQNITLILNFTFKYCLLHTPSIASHFLHFMPYIALLQKLTLSPHKRAMCVRVFVYYFKTKTRTTVYCNFFFCIFYYCYYYIQHTEHI